jgi:Domain of unknown function (DUF4440)
MGEAREAMDRLTEAFTSRDVAAIGECYAENAVVVSPERGEIMGREQIVEYWRPFMERRAADLPMRRLTTVGTPSGVPTQVTLFWPGARSRPGRWASVRIWRSGWW